MLRLTLAAGLCLAALPTSAADWIHWRGPDQNGTSKETGLPDEWDPRTPGKNNLLWRAPYGCRSTPLIMGGKVFIISSFGDVPRVPSATEKLTIGERVVCLDAKTGKMIWEHKYNVFHTDIVTNRLGWANLSADPDNKLIFAHGTPGNLTAYEAATGKVVWERQLTEEFGRVTGYGGRIVSPTFDSGLVVVGIVNSAWGTQSRGAQRFVALDGKTGKIVWWNETPMTQTRTWYSNPVVTEQNGQRLMVVGGSDGAAHAFQVTTGKLVWSYKFGAGVINGSPVVEGSKVWIAHGEENVRGGDLGHIVCLDMADVKNNEPKLVWEYAKGQRFGLASPALFDNKLFIADDAAKLYVFNAKTGKLLYKLGYGTTSRGAPVIADGKIYVAEVNAQFHIIKFEGDKAPDDTDFHTTKFRNPKGGVGFVETNGTPAIADGCVFIGTRDDLYCISETDKEKKKAESRSPRQVSVEEAPKAGGSAPVPGKGPPNAGALAQLQLVPADVTVKPGDRVVFDVRGFDANGNPVVVQSGNLDFTIAQPPLPKGAKSAPPPLKGTVEPGLAVVTVDPAMPAQHGYVELKIDNVKTQARIRVAPRVPYAQNFDKIPAGAAPAGWINTAVKFVVVDDPDAKDGKILSKVNSSPLPPITRANAYITGSDAADYTIECDVKGVQVRGRLPDLGVINSRYTLILDGKDSGEAEPVAPPSGKEVDKDEKKDVLPKDAPPPAKKDGDTQRSLRISSWEVLPRVEERVTFNWKANTWYRLKFEVKPGAKGATVRGKVWERGTEEPAKWTIQFDDPMPNVKGAAGLYGYVSNATESDTGSEAYYDNVKISQNAKK